MKNLRIEIIKNKETSLIIDDIGTAIKENNILKDGYLKAIEAFRRYMDQTYIVRDKLNRTDKSDSQINDVLYQSPHNIIAFSGKRGTGKTSAMISFAEFLKSGGENSTDSRSIWKEKFSGLHTLVLSPIDPTMLENDQDILSVVLSRLLYKAEERWNRNIDFHRGAQSLDKNKNDLLKKANSCLNGIMAVKKKGEIKSLADLQRIGDSAVLKKNLFDFVDIVNTFCLGGDYVTPESCILVIPIDDTDCQIQKAHEVMEDIRRYLTLPNVIILMATDGDMLRTVIAQHYAAEFKTGIDRKFLDTVEMEHYAEKYLTKLIPSTQRVYLPIFDSILDGNSSKLEMGYYDDESKDKDLISETTRSEREQNQNKNVIDCNFQAKVLTFIFKRTGIVFVDHAAYINDIIPTTMRGLAHLLNFLYHMKKVEDIGDILEAVPQEFIERVENRLTAIKHNLDLFEEYFMNEWVPAKVDGEMVKILKGIQEQVDENIIRYAFNEMYDMYNYDKIMPTGTGRLDGGTYYTLMEMLSGINGSLEENEPAMMYKHKIDYYNTFAVRTLLTIKKNKQAIKLKFEAIRKARENQEGGIDYSPFELRKFIPYRLLNENSAGEYNKRIRPVVKLYAQLLNDENAIVEKKLSQNERFCMHEFSWIVLCNWEVQSVIYKAVVNYSKLEKKKTPGDVWKHILDAISEKNCGMLKPIITGGAVQIDKWPDEFSNTYSTETNKSEKKNNDDNSEHESENINRVNETGITTISQMIVNIQSKLEKDSVGNLSVLKDSLADVNGLLVKKKKELEKVRDEIRKDNPSNEKGEYGELIDVFEKHVIEGESILYLINKGFERSNSDMEQPESETTQPFGEDNALSDDMVKKVNDWLSRIRVDNEKAEWLLTQANKGIHPVD